MSSASRRSCESTSCRQSPSIARNCRTFPTGAAGNSLAVMETLKAKARAAGFVESFLPEGNLAQGLTNVEYAPLAEITGRSSIAPEVFNCNAPDTGNMEVLVKYGSEEQKERWLKPLLAGEIRSAFCMTEPDVASSDATNIQATARIEGDHVVLNGLKWWSSGIGHPHCRLLIFMGITDRSARSTSVIPWFWCRSILRASRSSAWCRCLVLMTPVRSRRGQLHNVRVPLDHIIAGPGRGFEIAQGRLGPGRIHHCMRTLGAAERALELLCCRSLQRVAFGKAAGRTGR
jgi:acyl-CoA dehydrogenase